MKKIWGITFGGLHNKILAVLLVFLLALVGLFLANSAYRTVQLRKIVGSTDKEQQEAIMQTSNATMHKVIEDSLTQINELQADELDSQFAETKDNVRMLRALAERLFEKRIPLSRWRYLRPTQPMTERPLHSCCSRRAWTIQSPNIPALRHI